MGPSGVKTLYVWHSIVTVVAYVPDWTTFFPLMLFVVAGFPLPVVWTRSMFWIGCDSDVQPSILGSSAICGKSLHSVRLLHNPLKQLSIKMRITIAKSYQISFLVSINNKSDNEKKNHRQVFIKLKNLIEKIREENVGKRRRYLLLKWEKRCFVASSSHSTTFIHCSSIFISI